MRTLSYTEAAVALSLFFWGSVIWAIIENVASDLHSHTRFRIALGCIALYTLCFVSLIIRCVMVRISTPSAEPAQPSIRDDACGGAKRVIPPLFVVVIDDDDELQLNIAHSDTPERPDVAVTIIQNP